jgi:amidase/aspartyl-tRNA(Asn)/glutamyl-tRNA(Gln) amidotransferase subunit A
VTVPDGGSGSDLPVGIQFLAGRFEDASVLQVARAFERVRDE